MAPLVKLLKVINIAFAIFVKFCFCQSVLFLVIAVFVKVFTVVKFGCEYLVGNIFGNSKLPPLFTEGTPPPLPGYQCFHFKCHTRAQDLQSSKHKRSSSPLKSILQSMIFRGVVFDISNNTE